MKSLTWLNFFCGVMILFFIIIISSCKKDSGNSVNVVIGHFKINNVDYPIDSSQAALDTAKNFIDGYYQRCLVIYLFSGNDRLRLTVNDWSWQQPPLNGVNIKSYMTCTDDTLCNQCSHSGPLLLCDGAVVDWITLPYSYSSVGIKNGYVDITTNDTINKTINCLFLAKLIVPGQTDTMLVQGDVNLLSYRLKN